MTEKKFGWRRENLSAVPNAPSGDKPDDNSKPASVADPPATQPDKTPAEVAPVPKS